MKATQQVSALLVESAKGLKATARLRDPIVFAFVSGLIGLLLRLYHLGNNSLWYDEGFSVWFASLPVAKIIDETLSWEVHPPTYYLLLHYWTSWVSNSEICLRLPSVLFGV